ncbi:winged helix-turn-helix domain-containing protein (plasmid) [Rhizobium sp. 32-5/1]|uniref:winged helix-turn-helix transcriptional regulator n=1 Tax=Rhizobium sp. 32-5/1 TaxID=3019602 RepID=UPI00240D42A2|nr:winged helix-turn-helix domain-containing protein [Rhizobium sp. 32-5/1]WEZ85707.1 winged helix-turn-helix domain-containing protein [Rhizobium sp. 32-5/1]
MVYADAGCRCAGLADTGLSYEATVNDIQPFAPPEPVGSSGFDSHRGVISPSSLAERLNISLPTVMRVIEDLIAEDLVAYDGFDETPRGRPRARIKFRGAAHAIIGIEAGKGEFYGAVANLEGVVQTEMYERADDDGERNFDKLVGLIRELMAVPARADSPFAASASASPRSSGSRRAKWC